MTPRCKLLGELYMYKLLDSNVVFSQLYLLVDYGYTPYFAGAHPRIICASAAHQPRISRACAYHPRASARAPASGAPPLPDAARLLALLGATGTYMVPLHELDPPHDCFRLRLVRTAGGSPRHRR